MVLPRGVPERLPDLEAIGTSSHEETQPETRGMTPTTVVGLSSTRICGRHRRMAAETAREQYPSRARIVGWARGVIGGVERRQALSAEHMEEVGGDESRAKLSGDYHL